MAGSLRWEEPGPDHWNTTRISKRRHLDDDEDTEHEPLDPMREEENEMLYRENNMHHGMSFANVVQQPLARPPLYMGDEDSKEEEEEEDLDLSNLTLPEHVPEEEMWFPVVNFSKEHQ